MACQLYALIARAGGDDAEIVRLGQTTLGDAMTSWAYLSPQGRGPDVEPAHSVYYRDGWWRVTRCSWVLGLSPSSPLSLVLHLVEIDDATQSRLGSIPLQRLRGRIDSSAPEEKITDEWVAEQLELRRRGPSRGIDIP